MVDRRVGALAAGCDALVHEQVPILAAARNASRPSLSVERLLKAGAGPARAAVASIYRA
jgi:hypothetical protein